MLCRIWPVANQLILFSHSAQTNIQVVHRVGDSNHQLSDPPFRFGMKFFRRRRRAAAPTPRNAAPELTMISGRQDLKRALSRDDVVVIQAKMHRAIELFNNRRFPAAEELYNDVYTICRNQFGEDDFNTLTALSNLALAQRAQSKYAEADEILLKVSTN